MSTDSNRTPLQLEFRKYFASICLTVVHSNAILVLYLSQICRIKLEATPLLAKEESSDD